MAAQKKTKKQDSEKKSGLSPEAEKAKQRPADFEDLSAREQWEIDKELGILDWDGD
jgi:hypothetical protein